MPAWRSLCENRKDESRYGIYAWCLVTYLATQLSKMLVAATFIPPTPPSTAGASGLPPFVALATGFLDLADAAGILYLLSYRCKLGGKEENVLAVGVGWGLAQAVAAHFLVRYPSPLPPLPPRACLRR